MTTDKKDNVKLGLTPQEQQDLLRAMFGSTAPDSTFYKNLFNTSMAVHLDPVLAFRNVCRCAEWVKNNNPTT